MSCARWQCMSAGRERWRGSSVGGDACTNCTDPPNTSWHTLSGVMQNHKHNTIEYYHYDKRHLKYYASYSSINDPHPQVFPFPLFLVEQITGSRVVEPISDLIPHDPFHNVHFFGWGNLLISLVQWICIILPTLIHHYPVKGFYRGTIRILSIEGN